MLTEYIFHSQRIWADLPRMDWFIPAQACSVQVLKSWGLVQAQSKNFFHWIGLDMGRPSPDWSIAGLVESLMRDPQIGSISLSSGQFTLL